MILNVNDYKLQVPYIHSILKSDQQRGVALKDTASMISASIGVPVIAVYSIISLQLGMTDEISKSIESLKKFYHLEEIIPIENS